ncbi:membrane protein [Streptomyces gulbargensis]|uniref:Membrane protein n=1 Tax=Streptomyces gulbargensis TaxID=364901 RepID=A0ABP7LGG0_9ACTN
MAVQEAGQYGARPGRHPAACSGCAHCGRAGHREAVAAFLARRDELAAGRGVPAAVAHSPVAARQWVSDELAQSARAVTDRGREAGAAWLTRVRLGGLATVWGTVLALLLAQALTAAGTGWTPARTAGLCTALVLAALLSGAAHLHRARGGLLGPLVGEDNRLSTTRAVAAAWLLFLVYSLLFLALRSPGASAFAPARGAGLLAVFALVAAVTVTSRLVVSARITARRLQKVRADRPRAADLFCDDSGRADLADVQYLLVSATVLILAGARLTTAPTGLPELPWSLVLLLAVSAAWQLAATCTEGVRPTIHAVVRSREAGDLDAPIRTGDDIEIRGCGFVPPGAGTPEPLTRLVVRIGTVHAHVPLVPVPGGFANPTDTTLTVPLPADVEPGRVEVSVVTAAGIETNRVAIDVLD